MQTGPGGGGGGSGGACRSCRPSLGGWVLVLYVFAALCCVFVWQKMESIEETKVLDARLKMYESRHTTAETKFEQHSTEHTSADAALTARVAELQTALDAALAKQKEMARALASATDAVQNVPTAEETASAVAEAANTAIAAAGKKHTLALRELAHKLETVETLVTAQHNEIERQRELIAKHAAAAAAASAPAGKAAVAERKTRVSELSIVWDFGSSGCTGWAAETIIYIMELAPLIPKLAIIAGENSFCPGLSPEIMATLLRLQHPKPAIGKWKNIDIFISHKPAMRYPTWPYTGVIKIQNRPRYVIGRSMIETHNLPSGWADRIESDVDEVWLPSNFLIDVFTTGGVPREKLHVIPEAVDLVLYNPDNTDPYELPEPEPEPVPAPAAADESEDGSTPPPAAPVPGKLKAFKFFSVFKWEDRKGPDILLRAFLTEFSPLDDVALYIHTYLYMDQQPRSVRRVKAKIEKLARSLKPKCTKQGVEMFGRKCDIPDLSTQIVIITDELNTPDMPRLYKAMNAFVLPTHGEGWGLPIMEAMAMGLPAIATNWSGPTDFMTRDNSYPIPITGLVEVQSNRDFEPGQKWAAPDEKKLQKLMRHVFENPDDALAHGRQARSDMMQFFSPRVVTDLLVARLQQIVDTGIFPKETP